MCFGGGGTKEPKTPAPPPPERDAALEGVRKRASANQGSAERNQLTGMGGIEDTGGAKSVLGG